MCSAPVRSGESMDQEMSNTAAGIRIPFDRLSDEAVHGLVEEFVTRDGTDYGVREVPLAHKVEQIKVQLRRGEAVIVFDPQTHSCHIVPREHAPRQDETDDDY
jgi:uncharacterized protein YheU (UPF0270 family)